MVRRLSNTSCSAPAGPMSAISSSSHISRLRFTELGLV
jgi:hypothetical protein